MDTFTETGRRLPYTGDHVVTRDRDGREFLDRHGVIAKTRSQLDSIECVRQAIQIGADYMPLNVLKDRNGDPMVYSACTEPDIINSVIVAAWSGVGFVVREDGSVFRSPQRFEVDTNYNVYLIG